MAKTDDDGDHDDSAKVDPNDIAKCALHHYHNKLSRGKPRPEDEWTIYAAIVAAHDDDGSLHVISCATGSKCTTVGPDGWVLRDSHAEVLCRRGLIRLLLQEQQGKLQFREKCNQGTSYRFKATLHLYVSHSPCGDASIYSLLLQEEMNFTGAKVIVRKNDNDSSHHNEQLLPMNNDDNCCVAREAIQELGVLRTKSARSNLPSHLRSMSMSCSDKLLRWCVLGLQGSWCKGEPIRLSSIVVSRDPHAISVDCQQEALERAICGRIRQVVNELQSRDLSEEQGDFVKQLSNHAISVYVVNERFPDGKAIAEPSQVTKSDKSKILETTSSVEKNATKKRKRESSVELPNNNKKSVCGVSINWQISSQETEIVVGTRGIRQGKKPKSNQDFMRQTSRLSRGALMRLADPTKHKKTFREFKSLSSQEGYSDIRNLVLSTKPFQGWLVGTSDLTMSDFL
jgi:tRNA-specific adenosine deaminase 1